MNLTECKIVAMALLGVGSLLVGMIPSWIYRYPGSGSRGSLLRSILLCFGGGVLLATSLLHMLPEAKETLPEYADVSFCAGFFLIYVIDEFVHIIFGRGVDDFDDTSYRPIRESDNETHHHHHHSHGSSDYGSTERTGLVFGTDPIATGCHTNRREPCTRSSAGSGGLLLALSAHSLLEGLAIGLQNIPAKVLLLLGAVASHKLVVGFCLGTELTAIDTINLGIHFLAIFIFSMGSVIGIGVGILIDQADNIVLGMMQALAGGTLLYVTLSEVLPRERARWHHGPSYSGILQFVAVLTGSLVIYFINRYLDMEHDPNFKNGPV